MVLLRIPESVWKVKSLIFPDPFSYSVAKAMEKLLIDKDTIPTDNTKMIALRLIKIN